MPAEIHIAVTVSLPDDVAQSAAQCQATFAAWQTFTAAMKTAGIVLDPSTNEFRLGPTKQRRRRRSKPRLVSEPSSAA